MVHKVFESASRGGELLVDLVFLWTRNTWASWRLLLYPRKHRAWLVGHCNKLDPREIVLLEIEKMTDEQLVFYLQPLKKLSEECWFARVPVGQKKAWNDCLLVLVWKGFTPTSPFRGHVLHASVRKSGWTNHYGAHWSFKCIPCEVLKENHNKKVGDGFWFDAMQVSSAGIGRWWEGKYFNISSKVVCWKEDSIPVAGHKESAPLFLGAISTWVVVRWISPTTITKQLLSYSGTSL